MNIYHNYGTSFFEIDYKWGTHIFSEIDPDYGISKF